MRSLGVDASNSIYVGPDGNLAVVVGIDAVSQDCRHAMATQLGSLTLNLARGVDTLNTIWDDFKPALFEAQGRALLLTVPSVRAVKAFTVTKDGDVASYVAQIATDYGPAEIAGTLTPELTQ